MAQVIYQAYKPGERGATQVCKTQFKIEALKPGERGITQVLVTQIIK